MMDDLLRESDGFSTLGISKQACKSYHVMQYLGLPKQGRVELAVYSSDCGKVITRDGTSQWVGTYDPRFGLFGQKSVTPGNPYVIFTGCELEALKLATLGYPALCVPEATLVDDPLSCSVWADALRFLRVKSVRVWAKAYTASGQHAMDAFMMYLALEGGFKVEAYKGTTKSVMLMKEPEAKAVLEAADLKPWNPEGILTVDEIEEEGVSELTPYPTGFSCIDKHVGGIYPGDVTCIFSGTGSGKTTQVREIAYNLGIVQGKKVGMIFLEEAVQKTHLGMAAIHFNVPLGELQSNLNLIKPSDRKAFHSLERDHYIFVNHFGSLDGASLMRKIDWLIQFNKCDVIILDHISIAVSGTVSKEGERKDIDVLMTNLVTRATASRTAIIAISHLKKPDGTPHEEGAQVSLSDARGSGGIAQMCATIWAGERDQQGSDPTKVLLRALKSRQKGFTGLMGVLDYIPETGRMIQTNLDPHDFESLRREERRGKNKAKRAESSGGTQMGGRFTGGY